MKIPERGVDRDAIFDQLATYRRGDTPWKEGRTFGYVFDAGEEVDAVAKRAYTQFLSENALDPTVFPSLLRLENEVVDMARNHLNGGEDAVGHFTSGGTESIILAVKTARDHARATRPDIETPEMILPVTAHAAFHKAAAYLDVKPVVTPVDLESYRADVNAMKAAITPNTILLVGSAPSYAHGVMDDIEAIGAVAKASDLLFHVDACIGGFLLPYFRKLGSDVPPFDLGVDGVTSISMDLHKYAYCPKGASVLLHRDRSLRQHQLFACASWSGYTVVNPTIQSSKSGGPLAAAWAVLNYLGDEGYLELARGLRDATATLVDGIARIGDLRILGEPDMSLLAFTSDTVNPFVVADEMKTRGWYVQAQLGFEGAPANIHLSVNPSNVPWTEKLLHDLAGAVEAAKGVELPDISGLTSMLTSGDVELTDETFGQLLGMAGIDGVQLPERMAEINGIMNALPPPLRERLLKAFINELFIPEPRTA